MRRGRCLRLPGLAVIETKTVAAACGVDRLLWQRGHRPGRISKYATGLAALRPELPAAPWHRTLRRHFTAGHEPAAHPVTAAHPVSGSHPVTAAHPIAGRRLADRQDHRCHAS